MMMWRFRGHPRTVWTKLGRRRLFRRLRGQNRRIGASGEISHYGDPIICQTGTCIWADCDDIPVPAGKGRPRAVPSLVRVSWGVGADGLGQASAPERFRR